MTPGAAAAAPSQPVWALPAHRTPQLQPLPLPRVCVSGRGIRMVRTAAEHGLRSDEESDASLAHAWGSVLPFPTFFLCTTQIFTVEVLISMIPSPFILPE